MQQEDLLVCRRRGRSRTPLRSSQGAGARACRRFGRQARCRPVQPADRGDHGNPSDLGQTRRRSDRRLGQPQPSLGGPRRQSRGFTFHRHRRPRRLQGGAAARAKGHPGGADPACRHLRVVAHRRHRRHRAVWRTRRARSFMSTTPAARASVPPPSISRACWSRASTLALPASTSTAP